MYVLSKRCNKTRGQAIYIMILRSGAKGKEEEAVGAGPGTCEQVDRKRVRGRRRRELPLNPLHVDSKGIFSALEGFGRVTKKHVGWRNAKGVSHIIFDRIQFTAH
jgi:hypothetical protein